MCDDEGDVQKDYVLKILYCATHKNIRAGGGVWLLWWRKQNYKYLSDAMYIYNIAKIAQTQQHEFRGRGEDSYPTIRKILRPNQM